MLFTQSIRQAVTQSLRHCGVGAERGGGLGGGGGGGGEQRLYRSIFTLKHMQRLINMKAGPCLRWSGARMLETSCRGK